MTVTFLTDQDRQTLKSEIVEEILDTLATPVFGTVDDEKNIVLTGKLSEGTYSFFYEDENGNRIPIGTYDAGGVQYYAVAGMMTYGSNKEVYLDTVSGTSLNYACVYGNEGSAGIYADSSLTTRRDDIKPIAVPEGMTKIKISFPNLPEDAAKMRISITPMTYDAENDQWIRGAVQTFTDYGVTEQEIPGGTQYLMVKTNGEGYPSLAELDLTVEVTWE